MTHYRLLLTHAEQAFLHEQFAPWVNHWDAHPGCRDPDMEPMYELLRPLVHKIKYAAATELNRTTSGGIREHVTLLS